MFEVDHVAIRVRSLDDSVRLLVGALGCTVLSPVDASRGKVAFLRLGAVDFEIIESNDADVGLDHLAVRVPDLDDAVREVEAAGCKTSGAGVEGGRGSLNQWLDSKTTGGVRIHLCQRSG